MRKHFNRVHSSKPKPEILQECMCSVCGKLFSEPSRLSAHEKTHQVVAPENYYYCVSKTLIFLELRFFITSKFLFSRTFAELNPRQKCTCISISKMFTSKKFAIIAICARKISPEIPCLKDTLRSFTWWLKSSNANTVEKILVRNKTYKSTFEFTLERDLSNASFVGKGFLMIQTIVDIPGVTLGTDRKCSKIL